MNLLQKVFGLLAIWSFVGLMVFFIVGLYPVVNVFGVILFVSAAVFFSAAFWEQM